MAIAARHDTAQAIPIDRPLPIRAGNADRRCHRDFLRPALMTRLMLLLWGKLMPDAGAS